METERGKTKVKLMNALKVDGVWRKYGAQEVLKNFSLSIEAGSFEALMGPSGSGKSTFLHLAAGLLMADAGSILIGEKDIVKMSDREATKFRRRHIGVVFQAFNLLNEKTVRENIMLPLKLDGVSQSENLNKLIEKLGLKNLVDKKPEELSGGEQQRVAIARALIAEPEIILADEPTGNLDAKSAKDICEILKSINSKSAILIVTHDPVVAACAKKVHFLKDGQIVTSFDTNGDAVRVSQRYLETYQ